MAADRLDQQAVLGHREDVRSPCLAVPAGDTGEAVGDVGDLDVAGRGVEEVEAAAGEHPLPRPRRRRAHGARPSPAQGPCRWQPTRWSLTMPTACMKAWTMVGPQNANPSALSALPIARETGVSVWISGRVRAVPWIGRPSTKSQRKRAKPGRLLLDPQPGPRARDGALDLGAVADDPGIGHQPRHVGLREAGDPLRIEIREGVAKPFAAAQDGDPRQAGLEPVEDQLLVERAAVTLGHAPLGVVIGDVERVEAGPPAAGAAIGMVDQAGLGHGPV